MKKAKLLFGENEPREEIKTRIPVWLYPSTLEVIDRAAETVNCKSRSEYLERAALFYAGYISGQDATAYLPPALSKVMRGIVRDTENRICRLLFKLAVELDMVMNLLAAAMEIPEARLRELRVHCIENVKKTNGSITMEDAVDYRDGGPVEKNHLRSVIWLTQAAKQGDRRAMYALGKLYLEEDDLPAAMRWFRQSAELGHTLAQYRLGKLLLESGDAGRNAEAVRWLTEAAEHGDQYAQYALGKLYLLGRQAPPDHEAAVRWLEQSAAQGNEAARATLEWMKHLRSPSVLSAATRLLHHMSRIFQEQSTSGSIASIRFTDSKLRQRIREKKIAMGHKPDDHEDQEIRMS